MKGFNELKQGAWSGFGAGKLIDENGYVVAVPSGICDVPVYYPITYDEFQMFDEWKDNQEKLYTILRRSPIK